MSAVSISFYKRKWFNEHKLEYVNANYRSYDTALMDIEYLRYKGERFAILLPGYVNVGDF